MSWLHAQLSSFVVNEMDAVVLGSQLQNAQSSPVPHCTEVLYIFVIKLGCLGLGLLNVPGPITVAPKSRDNVDELTPTIAHPWKRILTSSPQI